MRKDWTIIRQILLRLEESATPNTVLRPDHFESLPAQEVAYNMRLLAEAGWGLLVFSAISDGTKS